MLTTEVQFTDIGVVTARAVEENLQPGPGEILLAPETIGICGSDLHVLTGHHPFVGPPLVPGHEVAGTVVETGERVTSVAVGDRVLLNPLVSSADTGPANHDESAKVIGFKLPGAARTRVVVAATQVRLAPADMEFDALVLCEPLAAAVHAVRRVGSRLGRVAVIGAGPIGLSVLLALRAAGADDVTVVDPIPTKQQLATDLGAGAVLPVADQLPERAFTVVFDCVANASTLSVAARACLGGGAVTVVGVPSQEGVAQNIPLSRMQRFEIDLLGSGMYTSEDLDEAIEIVAQGVVNPRPLISARFPIEQADRAFDAARSLATVKVLIDVS